ncbi:MAG: DUF2779 domain-containing protein [Gammaproteobacteria bacterium]|nr:DUF2779 domain-containing protein [Gammaproteobacteria bacterium]
MNTRYFTKSLFKLALECPTKLYYFGKPEYKNDQEEDAFLEALKAGGYQVGALAKAYIDGGVDLQDCNNEQAYQRTQELLKQNKVTIFEALFRHENMQIRCDILIKDGDKLEIIEVKSSSYSDKDSEFRDQSGKVISEFRNKKGEIYSDWEDYLLDVAMQSYVISKALPPQYKVSYFLSLVDKDQICPVDGLNQKFIINRDSAGRIKITSKKLSEEEKEPRLLRTINVDTHIKELMCAEYEINHASMSFQAYVEHLAREYVADRKIVDDIGKKCADCQFNYSFHTEPKDFKSGIRECWKSALKWQDKDFESSTVLDIWNFRGKEKLIEQKKFKLEQVNKDDINPEEKDLDGMSQKQRQWRQIEMYQAERTEPYIHPKLKEVMAKWVFPLHFIDFETCTVAIPFHKGQKPYASLAFQFSHHIVQSDGTIEHKGEYIDARPGVFPNYDFVRALKRELEQDNGSIFMYAHHENSTLNAIYQQLKAESNKPADYESLCNFIKSITKPTGSTKEKWQGPRCMVDLEEVIRKYTYLPATNGRTTMKLLFPAVLNLSTAIQQKFSQPIYGSSTGVKSHNFNDWCIVEKSNDGEIVNPYKRLPDVFQHVPREDVQLLERAERIEEGGMASTAYALMQFSDISNAEREALKKALQRYCELDTLAMVMVYEFLKEKANVL